jgi:hypothetical protein
MAPSTLGALGSGVVVFVLILFLLTGLRSSTFVVLGRQQVNFNGLLAAT